MRIKRICILLAVLCIISLIKLFQWDYREVKLQYVGRVKVEPPLADILEKDVVMAIKSGKGVLSGTEGSEFQKEQKSIEEWLALQTKKKIRIHWEQVQIKEGGNYYLAIGCEIESIHYFYHSKYTNILDNEKIFAFHSSSLKPIIEQSVITIYRGDVPAADIGAGFPCD